MTLTPSHLLLRVSPARLLYLGTPPHRPSYAWRRPKFKTPEALDAHTKADHPDKVVPSPCDEPGCAYEGASPEALAAHKKKAHPPKDTEPEQVPCPLCDYVAPDASTLDKHVREAHPEKASPHPCPYSDGYIAMTPESLVAHLEEKHPKIPCPKCPFKAATADEMDAHVASSSSCWSWSSTRAAAAVAPAPAVVAAAAAAAEGAAS